MIALVCLVLAVLAAPFKSNSRLEAENAVLRHQLIVLRRKVRGRAQLTNNDRWLFVQIYRWFPSILKVLTRPATPQRHARSAPPQGTALSSASARHPFICIVEAVVYAISLLPSAPAGP